MYHIILKSVRHCRSNGPDKFGHALADGCTHIQRTVIVTTMSLSLQAAATKMILLIRVTYFEKKENASKRHHCDAFNPLSQEHGLFGLEARAVRGGTTSCRQLMTVIS